MEKERNGDFDILQSCYSLSNSTILITSPFDDILLAAAVAAVAARFESLESLVLRDVQDHLAAALGAPPSDADLCSFEIHFAAAEDVPEAVATDGEHVLVVVMVGGGRVGEGGDEKISREEEPFLEDGGRDEGESVDDGEDEDGLRG